jgi:hypothetical protein
MPVANLRLLLLGVRTVREIAVQKSSASKEVDFGFGFGFYFEKTRTKSRQLLRDEG